MLVTLPTVEVFPAVVLSQFSKPIPVYAPLLLNTLLILVILLTSQDPISWLNPLVVSILANMPDKEVTADGKVQLFNGWLKSLADLNIATSPLAWSTPLISQLFILALKLFARWKV